MAGEVYGFKDRKVAETLKGQAERQLGNAQPTNGDFLTQYLLKVDADIDPIDIDTPGEGTARKYYFDPDTKKLVEFTANDGTSVPIDVFNANNSKIERGTFCHWNLISGLHFLIIPNGLDSEDICKALCECGPYAMDAASECGPPFCDGPNKKITGFTLTIEGFVDDDNAGGAIGDQCSPGHSALNGTYSFEPNPDDPDDESWKERFVELSAGCLPGESTWWRIRVQTSCPTEEEKDFTVEEVFLTACRNDPETDPDCVQQFSGGNYPLEDCEGASYTLQGLDVAYSGCAPASGVCDTVVEVQPTVTVNYFPPKGPCDAPPCGTCRVSDITNLTLAIQPISFYTQNGPAVQDEVDSCKWIVPMDGGGDATVTLNPNGTSGWTVDHNGVTLTEGVDGGCFDRQVNVTNGGDSGSFNITAAV